MFDHYLEQIAATTKRGDAREESYYGDLKDFLGEFSRVKRRRKIHVTVLPKKTEAGNPDFRVWGGKHTQVGYIEAKSPGTPLDRVEKSEQLVRYLATFPNLILTDFYEFRLYRNGQRIETVRLAHQFKPTRRKTVPPAEHIEEFENLLKMFLQFSLPTKFTAESLAKELALRTRFLRDQVIKEELRSDTDKTSNRILGFYEAFRKHLIANLKPDEFADLYSQTITYGLFAARTRANGTFTRKVAYDLIPKTIGILREVFHFVSFDPPEQLQATVDDIAEVLAVADVRNILGEYFREGKGNDPIFHFYETFLAAYNPRERERRGVYYTPEPVVSYIVRSLNTILKEKFDRPDGFATQSVTVLDPAGGTLTFLAEAARLAVEEYVSKYGEGSKSKFIEDHILRHFYAFELMMAPYAAGHLKMGYLLEELGHKLTGDERLPFYLTNTLEMEELAQTTLPGMASLSEESHLAGKVKKDKPILVILGNPPYSGISANASDKTSPVKKGQKYIKGYNIMVESDCGRQVVRLAPIEIKARKIMKPKQKTFIGELIEYYKVVDGEWFGERKHWLQDDYVKFIRFAQWKIDQAGEGVVGFITNHAYLDNPTFRGMRQSLMNSFDEMYILDLHGNSLKKEKAPDGSVDQNVFDIRQGVAIVLLIKRKAREGACKVFHLDLWGLRDRKYSYLQSNTFETVEHAVLQPSSPSYFFVPKTEENRSEWDNYPSLNKLFPVNVTGIVTARDRFVIDFTDEPLRERMTQFRDLSLADEIIRRKFALKETRGWKLKRARARLSIDTNWEQYLTNILYRPFDLRRIYYTPIMVDWGRQEVMRHMLQENLALICPKQFKEEPGAFVTNALAAHKTVSAFDINYLFPLYCYPEDFFSAHESKGRVPNLAPKLVLALKKAYGRQPSPENIFHYIYGILYANAYRKKYAEFLKTDFPRIPFTSSAETFKKVAKQGAELVDLHLLKSKKLVKPISKCEGSGTLEVVKPTYEKAKGRVKINPETWFDGVAPEVWEYRIGGYQVLHKWLKDRKGRTLASEEVVTYTKIVTAIARTIEVQASLDGLYEAVESSLLEISL
ncbi:MAG: DNA methyltransferase [Candidatus Zixiibacteriota bacterium]|nr:MAG: DNA methyltransferase [candidate division Zixibacteria bacterium]